MMHKLFILVIIAIAFSACTATNKSENTDQASTAMSKPDSINETVSTDSTAESVVSEPEIVMPKLNIDDFELDYFKEVAKSAGNKNFSTSPMSVKFALAMLANISDTLLQHRIIEALKYESLAQLNKRIYRDINRLTNNSEEAKLLIGNSLWLTNKYPVNLGSKRDSLQKYFKATVETVNFSSPQTIERIIKWGNQVSDGNITPGTPGSGIDYGFIAMNLMYYAGSWKSPFDKKDTQKRTFHKLDSDTLVDMMYQQFYPRYFPTKNFKAVSLTLQGGNSVILILPRKGLTPSDVLSDFDSSSLKRIVNNSQGTEIKLYLPRFEISTQHSIEQSLNNMGINILTSQFKCIGLPPVENDINQLTKIKFYEEGVEAKSQIQMISAILCAPEEDEPEPIIVKFDRPFIYILKNDKTKSIIMAGIYAGPEE